MQEQQDWQRRLAVPGCRDVVAVGHLFARRREQILTVLIARRGRGLRPKLTAGNSEQDARAAEQDS
jgi:hypothetical protein